jgi:hypothetical protein
MTQWSELQVFYLLPLSSTRLLFFFFFSSLFPSLSSQKKLQTWSQDIQDVQQVLEGVRAQLKHRN